MTRYLLGLPFLWFTLSANASVVPPIPRAVIIPGVENPADANPPPSDPNDPAATAERIAKNAKELGDRLGKDDTGPDTQAGQEKLKKDIESLIKSMENPPPMGGGGSPPPPPMGGGSPPPPMGGGQQQQKSGRKPRGGQPPPMDGEPMPMGGDKKPMPVGGEPMPMGGDKKPMGAEPKPGDGEKKPVQMKPGGKTPGGGSMTTPALPMEDAIARDFWGNLPDLPRERMMQFFREQYMSRYKELLPQYYQSLAEKEKKAKK